jgi:hypothetical protein
VKIFLAILVAVWYIPIVWQIAVGIVRPRWYTGRYLGKPHREYRSTVVDLSAPEKKES